jgi:hypothetical protein
VSGDPPGWFLPPPSPGNHARGVKVSYRLSQKSETVTIRLPKEVLYTIRRRIDGKRSRWDSEGEYIKWLVITDVERKR